VGVEEVIEVTKTKTKTKTEVIEVVANVDEIVIGETKRAPMMINLIPCTAFAEGSNLYYYYYYYYIIIIILYYYYYYIIIIIITPHHGTRFWV